MAPFLSGLRRWLDLLYLASGVLGAICLIAIFVLITLQMLARWSGELFPGVPEYSGYFMAAASFLAFAHTLGRGAHIRVSIVLQMVSPLWRRILEIWCLALGVLLCSLLSWHATVHVSWSFRFSEISQGADETLLWIPQSAMVAGSFVLLLALIDHLVRQIFLGDHGIRSDTTGTK